MAEESVRAKPASKVESRKAALREHLQSLAILRLCSPSDDPEEQTGVIESYRYILINIKMLSKGLVSSDTIAQLDELNPEKIESLYDVYTSKACLDAIAYDVSFDVENISDAPEPSAAHHLISPQLIKAQLLPRGAARTGPCVMRVVAKPESSVSPGPRSSAPSANCYVVTVLALGNHVPKSPGNPVAKLLCCYDRQHRIRSVPKHVFSGRLTVSLKRSIDRVLREQQDEAEQR